MQRVHPQHAESRCRLGQQGLGTYMGLWVDCLGSRNAMPPSVPFPFPCFGGESYRPPPSNPVYLRTAANQSRQDKQKGARKAMRAGNGCVER